MNARSLLGAILALVSAPLQSDGNETLRFLRMTIPGASASEEAGKPTDWRQSNEGRLALVALIALYQGLLSSQDGDVCGFTPSCSQYAKLALERYGPLRGLVMSADRLQRCHGLGGRYYRLDLETGKLYDPVP